MRCFSLCKRAPLREIREDGSIHHLDKQLTLYYCDECEQWTVCSAEEITQSSVKNIGNEKSKLHCPEDKSTSMTIFLSNQNIYKPDLTLTKHHASRE